VVLRALESFADFAAASLRTPASRSLPVRIGVFAAGLALLGGLSIAGQSRSSLYEGYKDAARWINRHAPRNASVAATEIGVLGWNVDRPIVDFLGLLSLASAEEVGRGDLRSWLDREAPDYYVQHVPGWAMETPATSADWFARAYRPVFQSDVQGWSHVRVFERVKSRAAAKRSDEIVLLSPTVGRALEDAGATVGSDEKAAFNALLARYLSSTELQKRFERAGGTDLVALLDHAIVGDAGRLAPYLRTLCRLRTQLRDRTVVSPLAPDR
jgi:hypothetical protein